MTSKSFPLVTIAIPTYNRADGYLKQALSSAVNQTYENIEIIVSDNCSSDNTESVVKGFNDSRIRYFKHRENIGANNNFNFCLEQANGVYFLLLHDDDLIDNDFIEVCMKEANYSTEFGLIKTGDRIIDQNEKVLSETRNTMAGLSYEDFLISWFSRKVSLFLCSTLFNTEKLRKIGGFNFKNNLWQDVFAEYQLIARFKRIDIEATKSSFRIHTSGMTYNARIKAWCEDSIALLDVLSSMASGKRDLIRKKGMYYFATHNYSIANKIKSPLNRLTAYLIILKTFRYPPPSVFSVIYRLPFYQTLRYLKRKTKSFNIV